MPAPVHRGATAIPKTGSAIGRSEGLGLASLAMFADGAFSADPREPLRVDADVLANLGVADLERGMQVSETNPLVGLEGRADLLRRLGRLVASKPEIFGSHDTPRPGGLFDRLAMLADGGKLPAPTILAELLQQLGPIWPSRLTLGGIALGDCWRHPAHDDRGRDQRPGAAAQAVAMAGLFADRAAADGPASSVTDIDGLTGLAEYRNGGLFVDTGVLAFRDADDAQREHEVASPLVVEWRALTVALLDRVADGLRRRLGARCHLDAAGENSRGRHLGGGPTAGARTPRRRLASGQSHQRRHGFLDRGQRTWTALRSLATRWCSTS